jgi:hypothetical protein
MLLEMKIKKVNAIYALWKSQMYICFNDRWKRQALLSKNILKNIGFGIIYSIDIVSI